MQDVEKTEIQRNTSAKRMRRRNRLRPLYFLVVAVLVAGVGIALSMTAFFNIATIEVGGNKPKQYNEDEIAHASGVHTGDNMMRLNKEEVAQNILDSLVFVEDVQVEKKFPDVLVITVSASHSAFNVVDDSGTLQVSAAGKILKNSPDADSSLPTITGYEAATREAGQKLTSHEILDFLAVQDLHECLDLGAVLVALAYGNDVDVRARAILDEEGILRRVELDLHREVGVDDGSVDIVERARNLCGFDFLELEVLRVLGDILQRGFLVDAILELQQAGLLEKEQCTPPCRASR